ncbi:hypothetical protein BDV18DRAFT_139699 [Aspergillus unguis]
MMRPGMKKRATNSKREINELETKVYQLSQENTTLKDRLASSTSATKPNCHHSELHGLHQKHKSNECSLKRTLSATSTDEGSQNSPSHHKKDAPPKNLT